MENSRQYKAVNILIAVLGAAACIGACFIPAPDGILADGSISLFQAMEPEAVLMSFVLPSLLVVLAAVLIMIGKPRVLAVLTALAGGALFAWMDIRLATSNQSCSGTMLNGIGVILVIAASLLLAFGTPTARDIRIEEKKNDAKARQHEEREAGMFFADTSAAEPEDIYASADTDYDDGGIDFEALKAVSREQAEAASAKAEEAAVSSTQDDIDDITALLRKEISEDIAESSAEPESAAVMAPVSAKPAGAADMTETEEKNITDFYQGLESLFLDDEKVEG